MIDTCLSNRICKICLKCRHEHNDPAGPEICKEISTSFFSSSSNGLIIREMRQTTNFFWFLLVPWHIIILSACLASAFVLLIIVIKRFTSFHFRQAINFVLNILRRQQNRSNNNLSVNFLVRFTKTKLLRSRLKIHRT